MNEFAEKIVMFTDGSSLGNPGPGGWGAVVVFPDGGVTELGGGDKNTTNNRMELLAAIEALNFTKEESAPVALHTDSSYVINGITKWVRGWQANGWMTQAKKPVLNKDLWEQLVIETKNRNIEWKHVEGHAGLAGNEQADAIANSFAAGSTPKLFAGHKGEYPVDVLNVTYDAAQKSTKDRAKRKAYSYLSLVDGKLMIHKTWTECKDRVNGKRNVKFRKALSPEDEENIKKEWGV